MDGDQFSLCWNNFHNNLSAGFQTLLKDEDMVDVTLAVGGKFIKAHKTVLSICSPYFKELFNANPCKHPIVILPDVSYEVMTNLLEFMYQGEVSVSQEDIPSFMRVAEVLKIKGLTENHTDGANGIGNSRFNRAAATRRKPVPIKKPLNTIKTKVTHPAPVLTPPPAKIAKNCDSSNPGTPEYSGIVRPKEEPKDTDDDEFEERSIIEEAPVDMASMLDTTIAESGDEIGNDKRNFEKKPEFRQMDITSPGKD